jgi:transcription termination factor NusB
MIGSVLALGGTLLRPKNLLATLCITCVLGLGYIGWRTIDSFAEMRETLVANRYEMQLLQSRIAAFEIEAKRVERALRIADDVRREMQEQNRLYEELTDGIVGAKEEYDGEVAPVLRSTLDQLGRM